MITDTQSKMSTTQQVRRVFGCRGTVFHLTPAFRLLRQQDPRHCAWCGAEVYDASDTPVGQAYLAFGRFDLGARPR